MVAIAGGFAWQMAVANGQYFDAAYPVFALVLVFLAGALVPAITGGGERSRLKRSLDNHLAPAAMAAITRQPELLNLSGETRTMSYLICGIRRYPQLAEAFADEPEGLRRVTRRTMTALSQTVLRYHGVVDRITPGGLAAFFNAPLEDPEHAVHACECALAMTRAMEAVNHALEQQRRSDGSPYAPVEIGIGVHSGLGVVGDFGTESRAEYTVAGRSVQLAQEIEAASTKYGPAVIVTDATRKLAERNFAFLEMDTVITPNASEPVKLFALLGNPLLRASPKFRALATFHDHIFQSYRAQEWGKARALIEQCRTLSGASPQLYDLYMSRIAWFEANPPGENWNGAVRAPVV
jgi:adenylate cyclase